ncbi:MAG: hypothetical protein ACE5H0_03330 [Bacteroidota bacterium]
MSQQAEREVETSKGSHTLESALDSLWEKARHASEVIIGLREDKRVLQERVAELEAEVANVKEGLGAKAEEIKKLREDFSLLKSYNNDTFSKEEKEALKNKIQDLIHKINSHL